MELTREQARFLLDCVSFTRDSGALRPDIYLQHLTVEVSELLTPIANGSADPINPSFTIEPVT